MHRMLDLGQGHLALTILVATAVVTLALSPQVRALDCEGITVDDGCLFTITGGDTSDPDDGYAVTNGDDVPLWDFVRAATSRPSAIPLASAEATTLHPPGLPEGDLAVGSQQGPHELLQHP